VKQEASGGKSLYQIKISVKSGRKASPRRAADAEELVPNGATPSQGGDR